MKIYVFHSWLPGLRLNPSLPIGEITINGGGSDLFERGSEEADLVVGGDLDELTDYFALLDNGAGVVAEVGCFFGIRRWIIFILTRMIWSLTVSFPRADIRSGCLRLADERLQLFRFR